ncbi:MAG: hypothetical protein ACOC1K_03675 [Nanoarchaeota archaeon]
MKKLIIVLILLLTLTITIQANNFEDFARDRMIYVSEKYCTFHNGITAVTPKQAKERVESIEFWSKEFNDMYDIDHRRVMKDILAIGEWETSYLNFESLDNGDSFGVFSLQWDTVEWIAEENNWEFNRTKLINETHLQAKYAVWYYYHQLQQKEDRYNAIIAYNYPSVNGEEERWRKYFHGVLGVIAYHDKLLEGD